MSKYKDYCKSAPREYFAYTLYPFYHKSERMPWAAASVIDMGKVDKMIWLSGATGRDPDTDREPRNWEEERAGVGKVVGGIREQTVAVWTRIEEILDEVGAKLEDIVFIHYYLVDRDDWWDMWQAQDEFLKEHCPDLVENPRAATLLKGIKLDLPDMRVEIEVVAVTTKK